MVHTISFIEIVPLVPGKMIIKVFFTIYGHGSHLGHVTNFILINFHFHVPKEMA